MPQRDIRAYLSDIRDSINEIESAVAGLSIEMYESVRPVRSAVEREFMIIGEALRQLLQREPDLADQIAAASEIIAFRNHLAHGYFLISNETVWDIIQGHLPALKVQIAALIEEYGDV